MLPRKTREDQSRRRKAGVGQDQGSVLVIAVLTAFQLLRILSQDVDVAHMASSVLTALGTRSPLTKHGTLAWDWFTSEGRVRSTVRHCVPEATFELRKRGYGGVDSFFAQHARAVQHILEGRDAQSPSYIAAMHDICHRWSETGGSTRPLSKARLSTNCCPSRSGAQTHKCRPTFVGRHWRSSPTWRLIPRRHWRLARERFYPRRSSPCSKRSARIRPHFADRGVDVPVPPFGWFQPQRPLLRADLPP